MTISLHGLMHADTAALLATADHWDRVTATVDAAVEDLGRATRDLPHHWSSGPGAEAAQQANDDLRARIGNAYWHCHQIALAVRGFAEDMDHFRRMLHAVVGDAERAGLRIDLAGGQITGPVEGGTALIDSYAGQIAEILVRANDADRQGTELVDRHVLRDASAPSAELRPLDELALASLTTSSDYYQALWWDAQHPVNQERAIAEHPEIVGAAPGLPSAARDAANRLLLRRRHATLLTERSALLDRLPDQAQRDRVRQLDGQLAAVGALQRRLDDDARPTTYLTGYQPGREDEAVVSAGSAEWDRTDVTLIGRWTS